QAVGINDTGQISGTYLDSQGQYHGFLRSSDGTSYTTFDVPDFPGRTEADGINNAGEIVGAVFESDVLHFHGFLRSNDGSSYTTFDVPGSWLYTDAFEINTAGEIVGQYGNDSMSHGFLRSSDGSSYTTLDVPGAFGTAPGGINDTGQIVGHYTVAN